MRLLGDLEGGEIAAADLGLDEIARLLASAKQELLRKLSAIESVRVTASRRSNVISFRRARARLLKQRQAEAAPNDPGRLIEPNSG